MNEKEKNQKEKKPYQKPEVTSVKLVAEEAVLAECKDVGITATCGVANCGASTTGS